MKNSRFRSFALAALAAALVGCQGPIDPAVPAFGERRVGDQPIDPQVPDGIREVHNITGKHDWSVAGGRPQTWTSHNRLEISYRMVAQADRLTICGVWIAYGDRNFYRAALAYVRSGRLEVEDVPLTSTSMFRGFRHDDLPPEGLSAGCVETANPAAPWKPAYSRIVMERKSVTLNPGLWPFDP